jgi:uncharacterized protein
LPRTLRIARHAIIEVTVAATMAVLVGAAIQRVSGLGFALISAPFLVIVLGPYNGISLANTLAIGVSVATLATSWRQVDTHRAVTLVPAGLVGVLPGVLAARTIPDGPLQVLIGGLVVLGLAFTVGTPQAKIKPTIAANLGTGLASGFMTAAASIGGPALILYANLTAWEQGAFAATAQISFASQAALALGLKGMPGLQPYQWGLFVLAVIVGLLGGALLARRFAPATAKQLAVALALLGATGTFVQGLANWL